jgi:hypothetical protein
MHCIALLPCDSGFQGALRACSTPKAWRAALGLLDEMATHRVIPSLRSRHPRWLSYTVVYCRILSCFEITLMRSFDVKKNVYIVYIYIYVYIYGWSSDRWKSTDCSFAHLLHEVLLLQLAALPVGSLNVPDPDPNMWPDVIGLFIRILHEIVPAWA